MAVEPVVVRRRTGPWVLVVESDWIGVERWSWDLGRERRILST